MLLLKDSLSFTLGKMYPSVQTWSAIIEHQANSYNTHPLQALAPSWSDITPTLENY